MLSEITQTHTHTRVHFTDFSKFIEDNHNPNPVLEHFQHPKKTPHALFHHPPIILTTDLLSVITDCSFKSSIEMESYIIKLLCLASVSVLTSQFIHAVSIVCFFIAE